MTGLEKTIGKFASRPFLFAIALEIFACVMLVTGECDFDQWSVFTQWLGGLYLGNHVLNGFNGYNKSEKEDERTGTT